nr:hypothetical protein [uncultured Desulfobacter sp.]
MKTARLISVGLLFLLMVLCPLCQIHLDKERDTILQESVKGYIIPSQFTGPASLEFKGLVSDLLYLKIATFIGGKIMARQLLDNSHADFFYRAADIMTDLDPYFWDAYLMTSMYLAWDFRRVDLANKLLKKSTKHRIWDYKPPYYLGFNTYYFLKDNAKASKYMMEAAKRGNGPSFLVPLATRLLTYQNELEPAILLLKEQLRTTRNQKMRGHLRTRLEAIIILNQLKKKSLEYKNKYGHSPEHIQDLVSCGLIPKIPDDPYGGEFFITPNGRVFTNSNLRFIQKPTATVPDITK